MGILKRHPSIILGMSITILFLVLSVYRMEFLDSLELKFYDVMMNLRSESNSPSEIVIVDIDDDSIEKLGRWPWPRSLLAKGVTKINAGNPRIIGFNFILSEPEESAGLKELKQLESLFAKDVLDQAGEKGSMFLWALNDAQARLDNDNKLTEAIKASGKVVLPAFFKESAAIAETLGIDQELMDYSIRNVNNPQGLKYPVGSEIVLPVPAFFKASKGVGHINLAFDIDGKARRERLLYGYRGLYIPSFTLKLAALYLNLPNNRIRVDMGSAVYLGSLEIPTTWMTEMMVGFKGPRGSFKRYSYFDVISDKVPLNVFKNKLVLVGPSASGIMNPFSTPTDRAMPLGELSAHAVWSILNKKSIQQPPWVSSAELLMILLIGLLIIFVLPRLRAVLAGMVFVAFITILIGGSIFYFDSEGLWVWVTYPVLQLILGYIGVVSIKYFVTETRKDKIEVESAETNRTLGLSLQGQGMLDMAFDKFRRVPVNDEMKDVLYNLALDYERKRQYNKAASVFEYIEGHDRKFKDVSERKIRLLQTSETMVFGDGSLGGPSPDDTLLSTGTDTRPTLGRYEVIKQLGKGAMGIVYRAHDHVLERDVALKQIPVYLSHDHQLIERFRQEARALARLCHPHIVQVYDFVQDGEQAWIAMELVEGEELEKSLQESGTMSIGDTVRIGGQLAEALDYAHKRGVIHRDFKPANVLLTQQGSVKITDFGLAKLAQSSIHTQEGSILGSPAYMSPEQAAGRDSDARTDIYALGVTLFKMLIGRFPFEGEIESVIAQKLTKDPPPLSVLNEQIPEQLNCLVSQMLAKEPDKRPANMHTVAEALKLNQ
jgi:serine/threonine-protein kinase